MPDPLWECCREGGREYGPGDDTGENDPRSSDEDEGDTGLEGARARPLWAVRKDVGGPEYPDSESLWLPASLFLRCGRGRPAQLEGGAGTSGVDRCLFAVSNGDFADVGVDPGPLDEGRLAEPR